jgi:RAQPRD family integrative conjugative element protein
MKKALTIGFLALLAASVSHASGDQERTVLDNFLVELDALTEIVNEAERAGTDHPTDIRFDYSALETDLSLIRQGVQDYLRKARREPRDLQPLSGDYRNQ